MVLFINTKKALQQLAENLRTRRLSQGLTQAGLAERSGVSLPTLRKFEQTGKISLESFLKLAVVLDCLEELVNATAHSGAAYDSIDDVLQEKKQPKRQRGWKK